MWIGFKNGKLSIWSTGIISRVIGFALIIFFGKIYEYSITLFRLTFDILILIIIFNIAIGIAKKKNEQMNFIHLFQSILVLVLSVVPMSGFFYFLMPEVIKSFYNWLGWIFFLHN
jgi:hypothetical protein